MIVPADLGLPSKFTEFRSYPGFSQWDTAAEIAAAEYRFSGLQAPPGSGKSTTNVTASRIIDSSRALYLTVNKPLQNQLMNDFADSEINMFNLIGHSAYPCANRIVDDSGDLADMECSEGRDSCPYWRDVEKSLSHSYVTSNIANWVSIAKIDDQDRFGKFDFLVLDEAHNLETLLCSFLSIKISRRTVYELVQRNIPDADEPIDKWVEWAKVCLSVCLDALSESRRLDALDKIKSTTTKRLNRLYENLLTISSIRDEWIVEEIPSGAQLTPVFASEYAEKYLFRGIPRIVLSSATLTAKDFQYLGISKSDYNLIEIESGFDAARRPFYYWPTTEIDYRMVDGQLIQVMNRVDRIIESRQSVGWKGIIHSISYKHAERIRSNSRHHILGHKPYNAQSEITKFMYRNDPCVLCSPVVGEGVDFADDRARYQMIWKVPTKDARLPLIAARKKRDKKYPLYLAAKDILQMDGRLCRSMNDYGETFMLDKHWGNWMVNAVPWPRYFRASWRIIKDLSPPLSF